MEINYTGTEITFKPGNIYGGEIVFDCGLERGIVYFLEPLIVLAPFSKFAFRVTMDGITSDSLDQSIDSVKNVNLKILSFFGVGDGVDFKIVSRGAMPLGGGRIFFTSPVLPELRCLKMKDCGQIKKIRGVASTTRVSPQISNRMVSAARSLLNEFIPDIFIYSDVVKGDESGRSPGFSLFLVAESTTGAILSSDGIGVGGEGVEDMSIRTAKRLLKQISIGGIVDQSHQWMVLMMMALCPEDLSSVVLGPLTKRSQSLMEEIKQFLGVSFRVKEEEGVVSCIGGGLLNLNRRTN